MWTVPKQPTSQWTCAHEEPIKCTGTSKNFWRIRSWKLHHEFLRLFEATTQGKRGFCITLCLWSWLAFWISSSALIVRYSTHSQKKSIMHRIIYLGNSNPRVLEKLLHISSTQRKLRTKLYCTWKWLGWPLGLFAFQRILIKSENHICQFVRADDNLNYKTERGGDFIEWI